MKRREYLRDLKAVAGAGVASSLAGCPGGGEKKDVETSRTEEQTETGSDSSTAEDTGTDSKGDSSGPGVDANWPGFDGLPKLIPGLRERDYLAIVPGEMRPDHGLEQDPHAWWQINYDLSSHELDRPTIDDVGALEKDPGEVRKGGKTEIKGVDLHYVGDEHKYPTDGEWDSLSGAENVNSRRGLGIIRAAQKGDGVEVINRNSGDLIGEMFSRGQPDAVWVRSEYNDLYEDTTTLFAVMYDEEGSIYAERIGIGNPEYKDGAITKGMTDEEIIYRGEGASWEEALDAILEDP